MTRTQSAVFSRRMLPFLLAIQVSGLSAQAIEIELLPTAAVTGSITLLGDVAKLADADAATIARLQRLELAPTPLAGQSRLLSQGEVRELLALNGWDVAAVIWLGEQRTRVTGAAPPLRATQPTKNATAETASLTFVAAKTAIARGDLIHEADLELRSTDQPPANVAPVPLTRDAIGREALRDIPAGQWLDARQLRRPVLIRKGDTVTVTARAAGVEVTTIAKAIDQGSFGDVITLQPLQSREKYFARVVGSQRAEVYASGTTVSASVGDRLDRPGQSSLVR